MYFMGVFSIKYAILIIVLFGTAMFFGVEEISAECFNITDGMTIYNNRVFRNSSDRFQPELGIIIPDDRVIDICPDTYYVPGQKDGATSAIWFMDNNIVFDCHNSTILGNYKYYGQAMYITGQYPYNSNITVQNCNFDKYYRMVRNFANRLWLINNTFKNYNYTAVLQYATNGYFINNTFFHDEKSSTALSLDESNQTVRGNLFNGVEAMYLGYVEYTNSFFDINDNVFERTPDFDEAIYISTNYTASINISNNKFYDMYEGIYPVSSTVYMRNMSITNNFFDNVSKPIRIGLGEYKIINNNFSNYLYALTISAKGNYSIVNNNFHDVDETGYDILDYTFNYTNLSNNYWGTVGCTNIEKLYYKNDDNYSYNPIFDGAYPIGNLIVCTDDGDGDGFNDTVDNCPFISNPDQEDYDLDDIGDVCDSVDSDGDGYNWPQDCDDTDYYMNPSSYEVLNDGYDANCNPDDDNFTLRLDVGWNLVSMPIDAGLVSCSVLDGIWSYDLVYQLNSSTKEWDECFYGNHNFSTLDFRPQDAFWIRMNEAYNMTDYWILDDYQEQPITEGWNLIAYPWTVELSIEEVFVDYPSITMVYENDNGIWKLWRNDSVVNVLETMKPGKAYWVKSTKDNPYLFFDRGVAR